MLHIEIQTIPHKTQRYSTCGDYYQTAEGKDIFMISECGNRKYEALIAIHEIIEKFLCESDGVTNEQIDQFDFNHAGEGEPGDSKLSPYRRQHCIATGIERILCAQFGIDWVEYDKFLESL